MNKSIKDILVGCKEVNDLLGGRIFQNVAQLKCRTPYLVYQGIGSSPKNTLDCGAILDHDAHQFVVWDGDSARAEKIRLLVSKELEKSGYFYTGKHPDSFDHHTKLSGRGWDMNFWSDR